MRGLSTLFSIPLPSKYINDTELELTQLCFEIHGRSGSHYNLISDACTSVTAKYSHGVHDISLNSITAIGIRTQGRNGTCHTMRVHSRRCTAFMDGSRINRQTVSVDDVLMTVRRKRARVSMPNCEGNKRLTMWISCTRQESENILELVVARGDGLEPTAHGLMGT